MGRRRGSGSSRPPTGAQGRRRPARCARDLGMRSSCTSRPPEMWSPVRSRSDSPAARPSCWRATWRVGRSAHTLSAFPSSCSRRGRASIMTPTAARDDRSASRLPPRAQGPRTTWQPTPAEGLIPRAGCASSVCRGRRAGPSSAFQILALAAPMARHRLRKGQHGPRRTFMAMAHRPKPAGGTARDPDRQMRQVIASCSTAAATGPGPMPTLPRSSGGPPGVELRASLSVGAHVEPEGHRRGPGSPWRASRPCSPSPRRQNPCRRGRESGITLPDRNGDA